MSLFFVVAFFLCGNVKAADINKIDMDIYIDKNGDAHITEVWNASINQGTEGYRFYGNLGNSEIIDYSVSDQTKSYTMLDSWDVNKSFDEKAYKAGIYHASDHDELCFGISKYGNNIYTLKYTITGFVGEAEDSQVLYWELIPQNLKVNNVYIKVHADEEFADDLPVWGYGNYGGYAYVYDGYIEMSNDSLGNDEWMTLLVKFPKGTFETTNDIENNFEYYHNLAEEGATHYTNTTSKADKIIGIITAIINFAIWFGIFGAIFASAKKNDNKCGTKMLNFGEKGKKLPKDDFMFHELPCGKDIYRAYWLATNYKLIKKPTDFLGAILLKWTKQGKVTVESETKGKIFKKEETKIHMQENVTLDNEVEDSLYKYMYRASKDGILESHEFESWCKTNYSTILGWFDKALDYENDILINEGKLVPQEVMKVKIFKSTEYLVDESLYEQANYMRGLKNFFNDLGNMKDKEVIEVNLWEEYLMYAQIFGIAEKVAKQFKEMYPNVISDESYNNMIYINNIAYTGMHSASTAKSRAESYSSGGGGFSSGGGGGGSFGGGGGGGFR